MDDHVAAIPPTDPTNIASAMNSFSCRDASLQVRPLQVRVVTVTVAATVMVTVAAFVARC